MDGLLKDAADVEARAQAQPPGSLTQKEPNAPRRFAPIPISIQV
jgi:hypothetical protein